MDEHITRLLFLDMPDSNPANQGDKAVPSTNHLLENIYVILQIFIGLVVLSFMLFVLSYHRFKRHKELSSTQNQSLDSDVVSGSHGEPSSYCECPNKISEPDKRIHHTVEAFQILHRTGDVGKVEDAFYSMQEETNNTLQGHSPLSSCMVQANQENEVSTYESLGKKKNILPKQDEKEIIKRKNNNKDPWKKIKRCIFSKTCNKMHKSVQTTPFSITNLNGSTREKKQSKIDTQAMEPTFKFHKLNHLPEHPWHGSMTGLVQNNTENTDQSICTCTCDEYITITHRCQTAHVISPLEKDRAVSNTFGNENEDRFNAKENSDGTIERHERKIQNVECTDDSGSLIQVTAKQRNDILRKQVNKNYINFIFPQPLQLANKTRLPECKKSPVSPHIKRDTTRKYLDKFFKKRKKAAKMVVPTEEKYSPTKQVNKTLESFLVQKESKEKLDGPYLPQDHNEQNEKVEIESKTKNTRRNVSQLERFIPVAEGGGIHEQVDDHLDKNIPMSVTKLFSPCTDIQVHCKMIRSEISQDEIKTGLPLSRLSSRTTAFNNLEKENPLQLQRHPKCVSQTALRGVMKDQRFDASVLDCAHSHVGYSSIHTNPGHMWVWNKTTDQGDTITDQRQVDASKAVRGKQSGSKTGTLEKHPQKTERIRNTNDITDRTCDGKSKVQHQTNDVSPKVKNGKEISEPPRRQQQRDKEKPPLSTLRKDTVASRNKTRPVLSKQLTRYLADRRKSMNTSWVKTKIIKSGEKAWTTNDQQNKKELDIKRSDMTHKTHGLCQSDSYVIYHNLRKGKNKSDIPKNNQLKSTTEEGKENTKAAKNMSSPSKPLKKFQLASFHRSEIKNRDSQTNEKQASSTHSKLKDPQKRKVLDRRSPISIKPEQITGNYLTKSDAVERHNFDSRVKNCSKSGERKDVSKSVDKKTICTEHVLPKKESRWARTTQTSPQKRLLKTSSRTKSVSPNVKHHVKNNERNSDPLNYANNVKGKGKSSHDKKLSEKSDVLCRRDNKGEGKRVHLMSLKEVSHCDMPSSVHGSDKVSRELNGVGILVESSLKPTTDNSDKNTRQGEQLPNHVCLQENDGGLLKSNGRDNDHSINLASNVVDMGDTCESGSNDMTRLVGFANAVNSFQSQIASTNSDALHVEVSQKTSNQPSDVLEYIKTGSTNTVANNEELFRTLKNENRLGIGGKKIKRLRPKYLFNKKCSTVQKKSVDVKKFSEGQDVAFGGMITVGLLQQILEESNEQGESQREIVELQPGEDARPRNACQVHRDNTELIRQSGLLTCSVDEEKNNTPMLLWRNDEKHQLQDDEHGDDNKTKEATIRDESERTSEKLGKDMLMDSNQKVIKNMSQDKNVLEDTCSKENKEALENMIGRENINGHENTHAIENEIGREKINGQANKDAIENEIGREKRNGQANTDAIENEIGREKRNGQANTDAIENEIGREKINGQANTDAIENEIGREKINGQANKDAIENAIGREKINGQANTDAIENAIGREKINGQANKDTIENTIGREKINGQANKDTIENTIGREKINGQANKDAIENAIGRKNINGQENRLAMENTIGRENINGKENRDTIENTIGQENIDGQENRLAIESSICQENIHGQKNRNAIEHTVRPKNMDALENTVGRENGEVTNGKGNKEVLENTSCQEKGEDTKDVLATKNELSDSNNQETTDVFKNMNRQETTDMFKNMNRQETTDVFKDMNRLETTDMFKNMNRQETTDYVFKNMNRHETTDVFKNMNRQETTDVFKNMSRQETTDVFENINRGEKYVLEGSGVLESRGVLADREPLADSDNHGRDVLDVKEETDDNEKFVGIHKRHRQLSPKFRANSLIKYCVNKFRPSKSPNLQKNVVIGKRNSICMYNTNANDTTGVMDIDRPRSSHDQSRLTTNASISISCQRFDRSVTGQQEVKATVTNRVDDKKHNKTPESIMCEREKQSDVTCNLKSNDAKPMNETNDLNGMAGKENKHSPPQKSVAKERKKSQIVIRGKKQSPLRQCWQKDAEEGEELRDHDKKMGKSTNTESEKGSRLPHNTSPVHGQPLYQVSQGFVLTHTDKKNDGTNIKPDVPNDTSREDLESLLLSEINCAGNSQGKHMIKHFFGENPLRRKRRRRSQESFTGRKQQIEVRDIGGCVNQQDSESSKNYIKFKYFAIGDSPHQQTSPKKQHPSLSNVKHESQLSQSIELNQTNQSKKLSPMASHGSFKMLQMDSTDKGDKQFIHADIKGNNRFSPTLERMLTNNEDSKTKHVYVYPSKHRIHGGTEETLLKNQNGYKTEEDKKYGSSLTGTLEDFLKVSERRENPQNNVPFVPKGDNKMTDFGQVVTDNSPPKISEYRETKARNGNVHTDDFTLQSAANGCRNCQDKDTSEKKILQGKMCQALSQNVSPRSALTSGDSERMTTGSRKDCAFSWNIAGNVRGSKHGITLHETKGFNICNNLDVPIPTLSLDKCGKVQYPQIDQIIDTSRDSKRFVEIGAKESHIRFTNLNDDRLKYSLCEKQIQHISSKDFPACSNNTMSNACKQNLMSSSDSPEKHCTRRSYSPDKNVIGRDDCPEKHGIRRIYSPDKNITKRGDSPEKHVVRRTYSPDKNIMKRGDSPEMHGVRRSYSPNKNIMRRGDSPEKHGVRRNDSQAWFTNLNDDKFKYSLCEKQIQQTFSQDFPARSNNTTSNACKQDDRSRSESPEKHGLSRNYSPDKNVMGRGDSPDKNDMRRSYSSDKNVMRRSYSLYKNVMGRGDSPDKNDMRRYSPDKNVMKRGDCLEKRVMRRSDSQASVFSSDIDLSWAGSALDSTSLTCFTDTVIDGNDNNIGQILDMDPTTNESISTMPELEFIPLNEINILYEDKQSTSIFGCKGKYWKNSGQVPLFARSYIGNDLTAFIVDDTDCMMEDFNDRGNKKNSEVETIRNQVVSDGDNPKGSIKTCLQGWPQSLNNSSQQESFNSIKKHKLPRRNVPPSPRTTSTRADEKYVLSAWCHANGRQRNSLTSYNAATTNDDLHLPINSRIVPRLQNRFKTESLDTDGYSKICHFTSLSSWYQRRIESSRWSNGSPFLHKESHRQCHSEADVTEINRCIPGVDEIDADGQRAKSKSLELEMEDNSLEDVQRTQRDRPTPARHNPEEDGGGGDDSKSSDLDLDWYKPLARPESSTSAHNMRTYGYDPNDDRLASLGPESLDGSQQMSSYSYREITLPTITSSTHRQEPGSNASPEHTRNGQTAASVTILVKLFDNPSDP